MRHFLCLLALSSLVPNSLQLILPPLNETTENPTTTEVSDSSTPPNVSPSETTTEETSTSTTAEETTDEGKTATADTTTTEPNSDISHPLPSNIIVVDDNDENRRLFWILWRRPGWRLSIEALIHDGHQLVFSVVDGHCLYNDRVTNKEYLKAYCVGI